MSDTEVRATRTLGQLYNYCESNQFAGYDPFDALNSPILNKLTFGQRYGRIVWIQFMKRFPFNLRPLLLTRKGHNPKGLGLFLGGLSNLYKLNPYPKYLEQIRTFLILLEELKSQGYSGNCWGYNFNWQSRAFFVPQNTPTIVNTAFIGHALLDTFDATKEQMAQDMALNIKDFILHDLNRTKDGDTFCFSYTPVDQSVVHNANLLGASLLIRLYTITGESVLKETALESLAYTMKYQREDGSWHYAETKMQSWVDSFHTAFNLEGLRSFLHVGEAKEYAISYRKGVDFYVNSFFLQDGTPKYYHNRVHPIDIHSPAEAVRFLSGEGDRYKVLVDKILHWMLINMFDTKGYFYYRKGRRFNNKISYMRWSQAWCFNALAKYICQRKLRLHETKAN